MLSSGTLAKDQVSCVTFDPFGSKFGSAGDDGILYLFSLPLEPTQSPSLLHLFDTHVSPITDVVISNSGHRMASGCKMGVLAFHWFDLVSGEWISKTISIDDFSKAEGKPVSVEECGEDNREIAITIPVAPVEVESVILTAALMEQNINDALRSNGFPLVDLAQTTNERVLESIETRQIEVDTVDLLPEDSSNPVEMSSLIWSVLDTYIVTATTDFVIRVSILVSNIRFGLEILDNITVHFLATVQIL